MTDQDREFEDQVRQIARLLWEDAAFGGAATRDGRERDGIFETRDFIYIVEATTSRRREKAVQDGKKTAQLAQRLRPSTFKGVQGWIVTKDEPTADQREALKPLSHSVRLVGFDQFRSLLFNGNEYLRCRDQYRFGSIIDYRDNRQRLPESDYVEIDFTDETRTTNISYVDIVSSIKLASDNYVIAGEYGSGKSMTMRALYASLRDDYRSGKRTKCPVFLNLRDHIGQDSPVEALERHARLIGYSQSATDLVRAWRAGFIDLFLDGFDEMATAGWGGSLQKVRTHRYAGMTLVRSLVEESPTGVALVIAGRDNFFDSMGELKKALGVQSRSRVIFTNEFNQDQLNAFLQKRHFGGRIPGWLPARPLLIAYLVAEGIISEKNSGSDMTPADGWDKLLDLIADREAKQDSRLDGEIVRLLIERLATFARRTADGLGKLDILLIQNIFREVAGFPPDEAAQQFILRLPGLGPSSSEDSTRTFVDRTIADAARSGDIRRFIVSPYAGAGEWFEGVQAPCDDLAKDMVASYLFHKAKKEISLNRIVELAGKRGFYQLSMDVFCIGVRTGMLDENDGFEINEAVEGNLVFDFGNVPLKNVLVKRCLIENIVIDDETPIGNIPTFTECLIGSIQAAADSKELISRFIECEIGKYVNSAETNADIFASNLPEVQKVLVTILRKLFLQAGNGRQESAFLRGAMEVRERRMVPEVLNCLQQCDFASPAKMGGKTVWLPNRKMSSRVRAIIASPRSEVDPLVKAVLEI